MRGMWAQFLTFVSHQKYSAVQFFFIRKIFFLTKWILVFIKKAINGSEVTADYFFKI